MADGLTTESHRESKGLDLYAQMESVAYAVLKLVVAGKLTLDEPLAPCLPKNGFRIVTRVSVRCGWVDRARVRP